MEKVAAAAAAAGVLKDTATQAAGIPNAVNAAKLAKIKAQTDRLTAETALATARANNADADVLAPMQAQTALAQAALAQINADAALKSAQEAQGAAGN
jgi:plasmid maintenance system antidote protein VapI